MRCVTMWGARLTLGLATLVVAPPAAVAGHDGGEQTPGPAGAKSRVEWVRVDVPEREDSARLQKLVKRALAQAVKKANFGDAKSVALSARVVEMTAEEHGDVLRITCTVMGRVVGGAGARSRISYGGSPEKRDELEKEVLTQVANGLVARLAQIVRTKSRKVD